MSENPTNGHPDFSTELDNFLLVKGQFSGVRKFAKSGFRTSTVYKSSLQYLAVLNANSLFFLLDANRLTGTDQLAFFCFRIASLLSCSTKLEKTKVDLCIQNSEQPMSSIFFGNATFGAFNFPLSFQNLSMFSLSFVSFFSLLL